MTATPLGLLIASGATVLVALALLAMIVLVRFGGKGEQQEEE